MNFNPDRGSVIDFYWNLLDLNNKVDVSTYIDEYRYFNIKILEDKYILTFSYNEDDSIILRFTFTFMNNGEFECDLFYVTDSALHNVRNMFYDEDFNNFLLEVHEEYDHTTYQTDNIKYINFDDLSEIIGIEIQKFLIHDNY